VPRPARALHPVAERDHVFDDARGVARGDGKDFRQLSPLFGFGLLASSGREPHAPTWPDRSGLAC